MDDFLTAIGLVLVLEGAVYALFPSGMKRVLALVLEEPDERVRVLGLVSAAFGLLLLYLLRG